MTLKVQDLFKLIFAGKYIFLIRLLEWRVKLYDIMWCHSKTKPSMICKTYQLLKSYTNLKTMKIYLRL